MLNWNLAPTTKWEALFRKRTAAYWLREGPVIMCTFWLAWAKDVAGRTHAATEEQLVKVGT